MAGLLGPDIARTPFLFVLTNLVVVTRHVEQPVDVVCEARELHNRGRAPRTLDVRDTHVHPGFLGRAPIPLETLTHTQDRLSWVEPLVP